MPVMLAPWRARDLNRKMKSKILSKFIKVSTNQLNKLKKLNFQRQASEGSTQDGPGPRRREEDPDGPDAGPGQPRVRVGPGPGDC